MRCKNCDYRLWNLVARRCPECGAPFRPSEFEFVPNSVQFCCPHCETAYYGTGPRGHLVPASFTCVGCGKPVHMDDMVLRPTEGLEEEQTKVSKAPWLEIGQRGFIKAWLATVGMTLVSPLRFMRAVPTGSPVGPAWGFAMLTILATAIAWLVPLMILSLVVSGTLGAPGPALGGIGCGLCAFSLGVGIAILIFLAVWGLVAHGLLAATGPRAGSLGRTYHALCYSSGANVVSATPCVGPYFGWIWWLVSAVLMLKEAQRVSGGRAVLAALALPILSLAGLVILYGWYMISVLPALGTAGLSPISTQSETQFVLAALRQYADQNGGVGPRHAAQLLPDGYLAPGNFVSSTTHTVPERVRVADTTLAGLLALPPAEEARAVQAVVAQLPQDVVAHRLGDYVFTHHGINLATANGQLWLVVQSPAPTLNPPPQPADTVTVGQVDGTILQFPRAQLPVQLARQNALRAQAGLAPLPDPATVRSPPPTAP